MAGLQWESFCPPCDSGAVATLVRDNLVCLNPFDSNTVSYDVWRGPSNRRVLVHWLIAPAVLNGNARVITNVTGLNQMSVHQLSQWKIALFGTPVSFALKRPSLPRRTK